MIKHFLTHILVHKTWAEHDTDHVEGFLAVIISSGWEEIRDWSLFKGAESKVGSGVENFPRYRE